MARLFRNTRLATAAAGSRAMMAITQAAIDVAMNVLDGASDVGLPRFSDGATADPDVKRVVELSLAHEREVEQKETDWLARQRR